MQVKDLMSSSVITVSPDESVSQASRLLARYNIGSLPVCSSDGKIKGIVTDRDIVLRCVAAEIPVDQAKVREIMTRNVLTVSPSDELEYASRIMGDAQIRRLPVTDSGSVVGMISLGDLAKTERFDLECSHALSEISMNVKKA